MSRNKLLWLALTFVVLAVPAWWIQQRASRPPEVAFAKVTRDTLVSTLTTNGRVEPDDWVEVRAERQGLVTRVRVQRGQQVARGAVIAEMEAGEARTELASANARVAQAQADLQRLRSGGPSTELAEIESALERARLDLNVAERDYESLRRLAQKQAATQQEVLDAERRVLAAKGQMQALERKRAALVTPAETAAAQARLNEALAARQAAQERLEQSMVRAPIAGIVYELDSRPGAFLNPGDLVAKVGTLSKLRVRVYVDEPELGRVAQGMPVTITWDALPGREWKGAVESVPTQVVPLGSRQVGEVIVTIDNPGRELLPGTNVNAEIQTQVVERALLVPKAALRRDGSQSGVYVLQGDQVSWHPIQTGAASVTRTQVTSGLSEGDWVALATEQPLGNGQRVTPVYRQAG
jgi:HlyD family secretion protein